MHAPDDPGELELIHRPALHHADGVHDRPLSDAESKFNKMERANIMCESSARGGRSEVGRRSEVGGRGCWDAES